MVASTAAHLDANLAVTTVGNWALKMAAKWAGTRVASLVVSTAVPLEQNLVV